MAGLRIHIVMPSELVRRVDEALVDEESRGEFVRRAVERELADPSPWRIGRWTAKSGGAYDSHPEVVAAAAAEQALREAKDPDSREQADPGVRTPGEGRSAAPAERPKRGARAVSQPGPDVSRIRSSAQVQRSGPIVKGGKK